MNKTQSLVIVIVGIVALCAVIMSVLFSPASLIFLAMAIWVIFILGEGDVGNPYKRGRPIYLVDNTDLKNQMTAESNEKVAGGYFGFKIFMGLLGALLFIIGVAYILLFIA